MVQDSKNMLTHYNYLLLNGIQESLC